MIDDIDTSNPDLWKYVDDTTIAEECGQDQSKYNPEWRGWASREIQKNRFQLNVAKCKELRISFAKHSVDLDPILVNGEAINVAHTVKLLGLNISSDLRWLSCLWKSSEIRW